MTAQQLGWALKERDNCVRNIASYTHGLADLDARASEYRAIISLAERRIPQLDAQIAELRKQHGLTTEGESAH